MRWKFKAEFDDSKLSSGSGIYLEVLSERKVSSVSGIFKVQHLIADLLGPPPLVADRVRRRGPQQGFALQSHPGGNAPILAP